MKRIKTFVVPFLVYLIAPYALLWSIAEPIPIPDCYQLPRLYILIGLSLAAAIWTASTNGFLPYFYYRLIRPFFIYKLQVISSATRDHYLADDWRKEDGTAITPALVHDELFGKVARLVANETNDAFREFNLPVKNKARRFDYFLKSTSSLSAETPVVYLRIEVVHVSGPAAGTIGHKWLAILVRGINSPPAHHFTAGEIIIYIDPKTIYAEWMFFQLDIQALYNQHTTDSTLTFNRLMGVKVRGTFDLAVMTVYK